LRFGFEAFVALAFAAVLLWPLVGICQTEEVVPEPPQQVDPQTLNTADSETDTVTDEPTTEELTG
jgi:hypothetical protein